MSSDRPSGDPSWAAERSATARVRIRGFALLDALERHAPGSGEHADSTGAYAFAAAVALSESRERAELVREAARLHDAGRVYVPAAVLAAPQEELSDGQRAQLEAHHEAGAALARGAGVPEQVCDWILHARERFDGAGPARLSGDAIPIESRIIRAACACDRLLGWHAGAGTPDPVGATVETLRGAAGRELDPAVTEAIVGVLERARGASATGAR